MNDTDGMQPANGHPAGPTHRDGEGCLRVAGRFGFNAFATKDDARKYGTALQRRGTRVYIWRLEDGTFDYTAIRELGDHRPWRTAVLVGEAIAHGRRNR